MMHLNVICTLISYTVSRYDWLALPHNVDFAPNEPVVRK